MNSASDFRPVLEYVRKTFPSKAYTQGRIRPGEPMTLSEARFYAKGLRELSDHFNGITPLAAKNYLNLKPYRAAYLLYFFPGNWAKIQLILETVYRKRGGYLGDGANQVSDGLRGQAPLRREFCGDGAKKTLDLNAGFARNPRGTSSLDPNLGCKGRSPLSGGGTESHSLSILDIGSGPGSLALGAGAFFQKQKGAKDLSLRFDLVDYAKPALQDAQGLSRMMLKESSLKTYSDPILISRLPRFEQAPYDWIFMGDFLNEIDESRQLALLERLMGSVLKPNGGIILVEPALRKTSRALQRLRDSFLNEFPRFEVIAPCERQGVCPLNRYNDRDWCHFYGDWERPEWFDLLEKTAGLRKEYLKYSYLALDRPEFRGDGARQVSDGLRGHTPLRLPEGNHENRGDGARKTLDSNAGFARNPRGTLSLDPNLGCKGRSPLPGFGTESQDLSLWRVISNPMRSKGKLELVLCGPQGRLHVAGLERSTSAKNKDFFASRRGDTLLLRHHEWPALKGQAESWNYRATLSPEQSVTRCK